MIRLTTLGTTDLRNATGDVVQSVIRQPRRFALLVYLALESRSGFVRRDRVLGVFWPEVTTEQGRRSLSQALHYLRQSLGPGAVLGRGQEDIRVDLDRLACDACVFLDATLADDPEAALRLFSGDFLPGFFCSGVPDFDLWLESTRAELRRAASDAGWASAERACDRREWVTAAAHARRAAELAGEDEASVRRLMAFLAGLGDRAGALEAYDALARRLLRDQETEPAEPTRRLAAGIRDRDQPTSASVEPACPDLPVAGIAPVADDPAVDPGRVPPAVASPAAAPGWSLSIRRYADRARTVVVSAVLMAAFVTLWGLRRSDAPDVLLSSARLLIEEPVGGESLPAVTAELVRQLDGVDRIEVLVDGGRLSGDANAVELALRTVFSGSPEPSELNVTLVDRLSGKSVAAGQFEVADRSAAGTSALAARVTRFARRAIGEEFEQRRGQLAGIGPDVLAELRLARRQMAIADSLGNAGIRDVSRVQLAGVDAQLAALEARADRWIALPVERSEVAYRRMWAYLLNPAGDDRVARTAMAEGIDHAARAIALDPQDARGFELRGVFRYFLLVTAPAESAAAAAPLRALAKADLEHATSLSRESARAWNYLSVIMFGQGDFTGAYAAANKALLADEFMNEAFANRIRLFWSALETGDVHGAARWCRDIEEHEGTIQSPDGEYCRLVLGAWAPAQYPLDAAELDDITRAAYASPMADTPRIQAVHAINLVHLGRAAAARALLEPLERAMAQDAGLTVDVAWVYDALGEHARAQQLVREFVAKHPTAGSHIARSRRFQASRTAVTQDAAAAHLTARR